MKLVITKSTGKVILCPRGVPSVLSSNQMIVEPSADDLKVLSQGKKVKWVPDDVNNLDGPGKLEVDIDTLQPKTWSKLTIRRRLRALGVEEAFNNFLNSNPQLKDDWNDCVELKSSDPMFIVHANTVKEILGLTDEMWEELLAEDWRS